jgi:glycosyltransferase involved in cell wall biosynthesis
MATYNGSRFLRPQLLSILAQTRPPDEVVVFDDGSTDDTVAIAASLLDATSIPHGVSVNSSRLGPTANFEQAVGAAHGDIVVLADQDDVWIPSKLAVIEAAFVDHPGLGALFSDAALVDADGNPREGTLWQQVGMCTDDVRRFGTRRGVDVLLRQNVVTGATLAFDGALRDLLLPFPATGYHDAWIALLAAAVAPVLAVEQPLIDYRLHDANTAGLPARDVLGRIAARRRRTRVHEQAAAFFQAALDRLGERGAGDGASIAALNSKVAHLRFRQELSRNPLRRLLPVLTHMARGDYRRFSREGPRSAVYDLLYG